jgi:glycosyltransferase involved in cell wall biosynthesis
MRVDQLVPAFHRGDAIGDEAAHLRQFFRSRGWSSEIYRLTCDRDLERESREFSAFPEPEPEDVVILHFAVPSPLTGALRRFSCKKMIIYHNVTAPEFFRGLSEEMVDLTRRGREELRSLAGAVDLSLADSRFNAEELTDLGFKEVHVFPLFVDWAKYEKPMNAFLHKFFRDGRTNILFVGRVAPNKKIEDLVKVVFYYKKYISPLVRLIIVGKTSSLPVYYHSLVRLADDFILKPDDICFTGHVPDEDMFALYRASDVFLSLSEHEGFCLPLVESMIFDLPVIAYNSAAVPDTLEGSGILINEKRVDGVAELVGIVARNRDIREKIVAGQRARLEKLKTKDREAFLLRCLESLGKKGPGRQ